ncbi:DUF1622 domain-containing protein [Candidatus Micrarchaeota archaeon]|nr:DUF1622 domain-containing protein [Candidatus Micrarchaeota archaeon]MBD3417418.1 DUF1622 domain-containing protein [Candidatus Micrarchaeota archaeon]
MLELAVEYITLILNILGALIVIYGSLQAFAKVLRIEFRLKKKFHSYEHTKRTYVQKLILALDFFVAADLLRLVAMPTIDEIILIALIVLIRTVLNYSLSKEIHLHEE